jgi:hypothetical protein
LLSTLPRLPLRQPAAVGRPLLHQRPHAAAHAHAHAAPAASRRQQQQVATALRDARRCAVVSGAQAVEELDPRGVHAVGRREVQRAAVAELDLQGAVRPESRAKRARHGSVWFAEPVLHPRRRGPPPVRKSGSRPSARLSISPSPLSLTFPLPHPHARAAFPSCSPSKRLALPARRHQPLSALFVPSLVSPVVHAPSLTQLPARGLS